MKVLVSYPKSGNTWVKFILASLHRPKVKMDFKKAISYIPSPDSKDEMAVAVKEPFMHKKHAMDYDADNQYIYIVRNPWDVMVSWWHHEKKFAEYKGSLKEFVSERMEYAEGWGRHVKWALDVCIPLVKYEDLLQSPVEEMTKIVQALGLDFSRKQIETAVEKCSFKNMQKLEKEKGLGDIYSPSKNDKILFVRKGTENYKMDQELRDGIYAANKEVIDWLGYTDRLHVD